jgi:hypothetical protein
MVLIFDTRRVDGAMPHPAGFALFPPRLAGSHLCAIGLPHGPIAQRGDPLVQKSYATDVGTDAAGGVHVTVHESCRDVPAGAKLTYHFDNSLHVLSVEGDDNYDTGHALLTGRPLDSAALLEIGQRVEFHDGERWSSEPPPGRLHAQPRPMQPRRP